MYYVYFIEEQSKQRNKAVKVGYSKTPEKRLKELQTGNSNKLKLCLSLPYEDEREAILMERCLHFIASKRFKRLNGEWFIVYGSWKKLVGQAQKKARGIIKSNPNKYAGLVDKAIAG